MRSLFAAFLLTNAALVMAAPASRATTQPAAGAYSATIHYVSVSSKGGAACPAQGSTVTGTFNYAGPGKLPVLYTPTLQSRALVIYLTQFTKAPAAGATTWNGTAGITDSSTPSGASFATFSATLSYNDASSFSAIFNWNSSMGLGSCTETIAMSFVRL